MPLRRAHAAQDICAIFVHAGAGYHSVLNEKLHLGAVNDAARIGMAVLKSGGDATDAVEMAIRLLEDREITNAGYGSNLTIEGQVECDATMVDHLGRSGAVGAVSQIKNPIALARVVLEASSTPLSLQRVPPNFVVGPGAIDFAAAHGLPVLPNEYLVSETAWNRWLAWEKDLMEANKKEESTNIGKVEIKKMLQAENGHIRHSATNIAYPPGPSIETSNEDYLRSPPPSAPRSGSHAKLGGLPTSPVLLESIGSKSGEPNGGPDHYHKYARVSEWARRASESDMTVNNSVDEEVSTAKRQRLDGVQDIDIPNGKISEPSSSNPHVPQNNNTEMGDHITDTVGCIAVDCFGNIAAGSSSGGIGMKHKGRCGPAALVGVGTAVIPVDPNDPEQTCVATVTSGTGEHMATTAAAATAANRIYYQVRKDGAGLSPCNEDEALYSMIKSDFMQHPGVQNQPCVGAIGILAVKKTKSGIYLYFGHNTDSFAIASMSSDERRPACTMSRNKGSGSIAQGGRALRGR